MSQIIKKENIVISIREYTDNQTGQQKKVYKTVGELVTMKGDDGSIYQFGEMWGPLGASKFNIYDQQERQSGQQNNQQGQQQNNQQGQQQNNQQNNGAGYNNQSEPQF